MKELMEQAEEFENRKLTRMSTSDRIQASRDAKSLILSINQIYKRTQDSKLMDLMKRLTEKKKKIEKRLKGRPVL